jgi:hypothetical protein
VVGMITLPSPIPMATASMTNQEIAEAMASTLLTVVSRAHFFPLPCGPALRSQYTQEADPARERPSVHRVDYHLPLPGSRSQIVTVAFSLLNQGEPGPQDILIDLFDAIMTTWRWQVP